MTHRIDPIGVRDRKFDEENIFSGKGKKFTLLNPKDDVFIALVDLPAGVELADGVTTTGEIPHGHKVARRDIKKGEQIHRYGQFIGFAGKDISAGDHVHVDNVAPGEVEIDYAFGTKRTPTEYVSEPRTFMGIKRADGRIATRNYIGVFSSVNCSATAVKMIADHFRGRLDDYPNVDGVVGLTHKAGCGLDKPAEGIAYFRRALSGFFRHPNFAHIAVIGLGCEIGCLPDLLGNWPGDALSLQEEGGTSETVAKAIRKIEAVLPKANEVQREPIPLRELKLGMQCGGSDGLSGISANPALGTAVDLLVRHGATACLSETTECHGGEQVLTARATPEVGQKLVDAVNWWKEFAAAQGLVLNNNPSPGNVKGGLTTILEKSLGSIAKGGSTNLNEVYGYAEPVEAGKGLVFMNAPAFDPFCGTAQVAGGVQVFVFTTGRGSCWGCKPAPSIKLVDNTDMYNAMPDDMDINAGTIIDGTETVEEVGRRIFERIIAVASGEKSKSEVLGYGEEEFSPWDKGLML